MGTGCGEFVDRDIDITHSPEWIHAIPRIYADRVLLQLYAIILKLIIICLVVLKSIIIVHIYMSCICVGAQIALYSYIAINLIIYN